MLDLCFWQYDQRSYGMNYGTLHVVRQQPCHSVCHLPAEESPVKLFSQWPQMHPQIEQERKQV